MLDEFKRKYSNEDTLSVALPYFWDHFDKDGWSLWYSEYRFPEELTQTFMSCNLITGERMALRGGWEASVVGDVISKAECSSPSGMFQRLDKLRKNAFASVILFGTNNSSSISGVWVFRGQELAFPVRKLQGRWGEGGFGKRTHVPESEGVLETSGNVSMKEQSCSQASWALMMGV